MGLDFWDDLEIEAPDQEGQEVIRNGLRFRWTWNDRGNLYLKSLGQIGPRSKLITLAEYQAQLLAHVAEHQQFLTPGVWRFIGQSLVVAQMQPDLSPAPAEPPPAAAVWI